MSFILSPYRFGAAGGGGATDPLFANVTSLVHFEGANGSTTITDVKAPGVNWSSVSGDAQISTAQSAAGGSSLRTTTNGSIKSGGVVNVFNFGTGDFCVELFARFEDTGVNRVLWSTDSGFSLFGSNTNLVVYSGAASIITASGAISTGSFDHYAVTRQSGTLRLFKNGALLGSAAYGASISASGATLAKYGPSASSYFNGYIDEFRVTTGVARYTAAFTTPSVPFPDS